MKYNHLLCTLVYKVLFNIIVAVRIANFAAYNLHN